MARRLSKRCSRTHTHQHLLGGRAEAASFYSLELITEILRDTRDTADFEDQHLDVEDYALAIAMLPVAPMRDEPKSGVAWATDENVTHETKHWFTELGMDDGRVQDIAMHKQVRPCYRDGYTGDMIPQALVEAAMQDDLDYLNHQVWVGGSPLKRSQVIKRRS